MKINVTKAGLWAEKGIKVFDVKIGFQDVSENLGNELINAGRAFLHAESTIPYKTEPVKPKEIEPVIEKVEKVRAGWWRIKFESVVDIVKVRGKNQSEAIENAVEKLKVIE